MLRRVRIRGFKSFAGEVTLDLGPGVNVIVGPNGSGKSNFAEAIVWAMGEQRAGRLRAPGMADVLYSGSGARPGAGLAEVALQFEDAEHDGPAEVEVSRRLTRAGDADYRVNAASCRLLDVQEALAARGLGGDSLAVIRQGQVEALATSRPAQRRAMLDEAAGVGVAKRRRRRAELKLARVADKLDRARDLAAELGSRARSLERQARAAERAAALEAEIAQVRALERATRAFAAAAAVAEAARVHDGESAADAGAQEVLEEARRRRATASDARASAVDALERCEAIGATLRAAADRVSGRAELARERLAELESRQERLGRARADAARRLGELTELEERARGELEAANRAVADAQARTHEAEENEVVLRARELEAAGVVREVGAATAAAEGAIRDSDRAYASAVQAVDRATAALGQLELSDPGAQGRVERRADIAERRLERDRERLAAAVAALHDREAELGAAQSKVREAAAETRRLAPVDGEGADGLAVDLVVEPGAENAVAGALGAYADAAVAGDLASARAMIARGAAAVVLPAPVQGLGGRESVGRPLLDVVVDCPAPSRGHVERLLAGVRLVDDLGEVPARAQGVFVDREGVVFRPADGTLTLSRTSWARRAQHRRAQEAHEAARAEETAVLEAVAAAAAAREAARRRLGAA
jgi:chromosome segregation protein